MTEAEVLDALRPFWERARCAAPRMRDEDPVENGEGMDRVRRLTHGDLRVAQRLYDRIVGGDRVEEALTPLVEEVGVLKKRVDALEAETARESQKSAVRWELLVTRVLGVCPKEAGQ